MLGEEYQELWKQWVRVIVTGSDGIFQICVFILVDLSKFLALLMRKSMFGSL